jgi:Flp pilus assembly protein TadG
MKTYWKNKLFPKKENGQIIVIMALLFIVLIAIIGLAVDLGYVFVSYSRLRRAVDSSALAATSQFRQGYTTANLQKAAQQFLDLNGIIDTTDIQIQTCDTTPGDPELCTTPARKMVRVTVTQNVPLFFLSVVGMHQVPITVDAISEAASVDLVLLIDRSTSMALKYSGTDGSIVYAKNGANSVESNPKDCNEADATGGADLSEGTGTNPLGLQFPGECHPFEEIKKAAILLVRRMYLTKNGNPGYDRISIVTFDRFPIVQLELSDNQTVVEDTIRNLSVYQGEGKCPFPNETLAYNWVPVNPPVDSLFEGPCRLHAGGTTLNGVLQPDGDFLQMWSSTADQPDGTYDPRGWMGTNSGGGLKVAGNVLGGSYPSPFPRTTPTRREAALWVVVWLTDGYTNAGFTNDGANYPQTIGNSGTPICPKNLSLSPPYNTWAPQGPLNEIRFCVDLDARPTVDQLKATPSPGSAALDARHIKTDTSHYDPDDYARDMVDFVTDPDHGQGALLFTIGLGDQILKRSQYEINNNLPAPGETLLKYGAEKGGGIYYAAPDASQLDEIFLAIANKIATRLSR